MFPTICQPTFDHMSVLKSSLFIQRPESEGVAAFRDFNDEIGLQTSLPKEILDTGLLSQQWCL
jgi:hypothetical protein